MTTDRTTSRRLLLAALLAALLAPLDTAWSAPLNWTITITPAGGGQVDWVSSSPPANGTLGESGKVVVNEGAFLDLTFRANPGYHLLSVFKNADDWTFFLDFNQHFSFGPVAKAHKIVATYSVIVPTGSFEFPFPVGNPALIAIAFLTGNYTGIMPGPFFPRHYDLDVAMDEAGKLVVLGNVDGVVPEAGADPVGGTGAVKTVNGEPTMQLKMDFAGTLDGVPATAKAAGQAELDVTDVGGGTLGLAGTHTYKAKLGGVPFSEKNVPAHAAFDPAAVANVAKDWTLHLDIAERTDAKGKRYIGVQADLVLPDGDTIVFAERKAKYSVAKGFSLSFKGGTNVTVLPPAVAKKVKIQIKAMTLVPEGMGWRPSGGTIHYQFLGQKGVANLVDFLAP
jgi:hypothetical protein